MDGASFKIVNVATRTGQFSTVEGTNIGGGLNYSVQYNPSDVTLTVGTARQLSVADTSVTEGDLGTVNATFTVSLSSAAAQDVTVDFATADGSATAPSDYTARTGTLTIPAGQTSGQIAIVIQGDTQLEGNESFQVNLSNASANATIADPQAIGTIIDNEVAPPSVTINDVAVTEGDSGTTDATFTVSLDRAGTGAITVNYETANGTASAPVRLHRHETARSPSPRAITSQTITVPVVGDTDVERRRDLLREPDRRLPNAPDHRQPGPGHDRQRRPDAVRPTSRSTT